MKSKITIFILFLSVVMMLHAQDPPKNIYWNVLKKISNTKTDFFISNPVRFKDSSGNVRSIKNIVVLENSYMQKIVKKYGKKMLPELVLLLSDSTRDWAANIMLYSITNTDAVVLKYYSSANLIEWRNFRKKDDIQIWENYIQRIGAMK